MKTLPCLFLLLLFASCAAIHNTPKSKNPNVKETPNIIYSFVDQNGNFYPNNWQKTFGNPPNNAKKNEYSLVKLASEKNILSNFKGNEQEILNRIKKEVSNKKRIIIFVHGFNSTARKSTQNYELARKHMNINPKTDEIIQFYWDGLTSQSILGGAKIWFDATNYSQMAGEFGLRRILNVIKNKDIYIISHSRGASVVISALNSNPIKDNQKEEVVNIHNVDFENSKDLLENNNKITCIMLAPAIGVNDFYKADSENDFCDLSHQVQTIHITINNTDPLLKKFVGFLSKTLKPTDLGFKEDAYNTLCEYFILFEKTDFTGQKVHDFDSYIQNPKFIEILEAYGLSK